MSSWFQYLKEQILTTNLIPGMTTAIVGKSFMDHQHGYGYGKARCYYLIDFIMLNKN